MSGEADLAIGVAGDRASAPGIRCEAMGELQFILTFAPHHALAKSTDALSTTELARHRIVAVADTARGLEPTTVGILPGQDVLTVPSMPAKLEAQLRGMGCGFLPEPLVRPHLQSGRLLTRAVDSPPRIVRPHYAWRQGDVPPGKALSWWVHQLSSPTTRAAMLDLHEGLVL
jgi:DNA-binding transcriptional LysR family regulator